MLAIMYMKNKNLSEILAICPKWYVTDAKWFIAPWRVGRRKKGGLKIKACAIMLLKTNVEKMSLLGSAIISMKTKGLFHSCHHIHENK
jgi:hypothetical protein